MPRKPRPVADELNEARATLETWRRENPPRSRLPEAFWAEAVSLAQRHGVHGTARALRLDYTRLKKRMPQPAQATFVELRPATTSECVIELEAMRITLRAMATQEVASLIRALRP